MTRRPNPMGGTNPVGSLSSDEVHAYVMDMLRGLTDLADTLPDPRLANDLKEVWFAHSRARDGRA